MADDRRRIRAPGPIVGRRQHSPAQWRHAEHREEFPGNVQAFDVADLALRRQVEAGIGKRKERGKPLLLAEDLLPQRQRYLAVAPGVSAAARSAQLDLGELAGMRDGKAAKPQRVQQPEHGSVGAYPERKRDDRGCGERAAAPQQTQAEPDVVPQRLETRAAADVPYLCLDRVDSPELQRRRAPRLGRRRTLLQLFIDQQLECRAQLVVEVALDAIAMRDVLPQTSQPRPERHRQPPSPTLVSDVDTSTSVPRLLSNVNRGRAAASGRPPPPRLRRVSPKRFAQGGSRKPRSDSCVCDRYAGRGSGQCLPERVPASSSAWSMARSIASAASPDTHARSSRATTSRSLTSV